MSNLTVFPDMEQRSPEWYEVRRGIVTASAVGRLLTPTLKVADNDTSRGITSTLAAERITGWTEDTAMTPDMWRGVEHEPFARDEYGTHNQPVTQVGFMVREWHGMKIGYSPDGLVGSDGLIEVKCPRAKTHVRTILADDVPAQYAPQLQAALLVSGRDWCDFVSYVGGLPLYVKRVHPDLAWFAAITAACLTFEENVARIVADYHERSADLPQTERPDFEIKVA
jgi:putative phage-type endonuclease